MLNKKARKICRKITRFSCFTGIGIVLIILALKVLDGQRISGDKIYEISIKKLYKTGIIDISKLFYGEDVYYLRTNDDSEDVLYLKRGKENRPFSLNARKLTVRATSEEEWKKALHEIEVEAKYHKIGGFITDKGELKNIYTQEIIKPSGKYIIDFSVSPSGKFIYVFSLSGYYKEARGIGFLIGSPSRRMGMKYIEIFNLKTGGRVFFNKTISFSKSYRPHLLFWLENRRLMIFSKHRFGKYLMVLKY